MVNAGTSTDPHYEAALQEALAGFDEGGLPIGSALACGGELVGRGHNQRLQRADPTAHAEIECLRNAGRRSTYEGCVLYTTLAPCFLCSGAIALFGITRVVAGESRTFDGEGSMDFLRARGVEIVDLDDHRAREVLERFIAASPEVWLEDIGKVDG
jgi:cytosine deaminase